MTHVCLPTSPAIPTMFAGCGMNGRDFDFSAIITTLEDLDETLATEKAEADANRATSATIE